MPTLTVSNPATGLPIAELLADDAASVATPAAAAGAALVADHGVLAATLTQETGKPISQSHNELSGLLPLGAVASISAWNCAYFVGCNVILPALPTGLHMALVQAQCADALAKGATVLRGGRGAATAARVWA